MTSNVGSGCCDYWESGGPVEVEMKVWNTIFTTIVMVTSVTTIRGSFILTTGKVMCEARTSPTAEGFL